MTNITVTITIPEEAARQFVAFWKSVGQPNSSTLEPYYQAGIAFREALRAVLPIEEPGWGKQVTGHEGFNRHYYVRTQPDSGAHYRWVRDDGRAVTWSQIQDAKLVES